jgi:hypothetical protein
MLYSNANTILYGAQNTISPYRKVKLGDPYETSSPKYAISEVVGFLKGKSAIKIFDM